MTKLLYQGHGSLRLTADNGTVVYLDPFAGSGYDVPADLVLVTHEHFDHNQLQLIHLAADGVVWREKDFLVGGHHGAKEFRGITIVATPAQNKHHRIDECVGYLIDVDGLTIYCAGDTSTIDFMSTDLAANHVDYAFLPIDGIFNMGPAEASACARIIGATHTIPVHTMPVRDREDSLGFSEENAAAFDAPGKLVLHPGDEIELES